MSKFALQAASRTQAKLNHFAQLMGQACMFTIISLALLYPPITISGDLPRVKIEQILLPIAILIYVFFLLAGLARRIRFNPMFGIGLLFCFSVTLSMYYGSDVLQHRLIIRDYYEIPKAWFPVAFYVLAYESNLSESSLRRFLTILVPSVMLVCLYGWAQFVGMSFTNKINDYYGVAAHNEGALQTYHRIYSTVGNANVLGQLLTWVLAAYTLAFLFRVGNRTVNLVVASSCLITIVMTGSRYGLITSGLALVMILVMTLALGMRRLFPLVALMAILPLFFWTYTYVATRYEATENRFAELKHPLQVQSLRERLDSLWIDAVDYFDKSPIVGNGPAKLIFTGVYTDSEYLNMLKYYGIFGFVPYLAMYLYPVYVIAKGMRAGHRAGPGLGDRLPATYLMMRLGIIVGVTVLIMNIGEFSYLNPELQGVIWILLGFGAASADTIRNTLNPPAASAWAARTARNRAPQAVLRPRPQI